MGDPTREGRVVSTRLSRRFSSSYCATHLWVSPSAGVFRQPSIWPSGHSSATSCAHGVPSPAVCVASLPLPCVVLSVVWSLLTFVVSFFLAGPQPTANASTIERESSLVIGLLQ